MRIDSHVHFWHYSAAEYGWIDQTMAALRRDFLPADAREATAASGIDACVAVQARQTLEETEWLLECADRYTFVAGVVGWIDLQSEEAAAQLERFRGRSKLVGLRHIVQSEPDDRFMLRPGFLRGISLLSDFDLTYDILIYPRHLDAAAELVSRFDGTRFVLDHLAKPAVRLREIREWQKGLRRLAEAPNVCCKVSGLVTEAHWDRWQPADLRPYLDAAFEYFGGRRLLFGSDWPVCTVAASYDRVVSIVDDYICGLAAADRIAIMGGNAMRLWKLNPGEGS